MTTQPKSIPTSTPASYARSGSATTHNARASAPNPEMQNKPNFNSGNSMTSAPNQAEMQPIQRQNPAKNARFDPKLSKTNPILKVPIHWGTPFQSRHGVVPSEQNESKDLRFAYGQICKTKPISQWVICRPMLDKHQPICQSATTPAPNAQNKPNVNLGKLQAITTCALRSSKKDKANFPLGEIGLDDRFNVSQPGAPRRRSLPYSFAPCRVTIGTYPISSPAGGVTSKAGSISASSPKAGGARYSRSFVQVRCSFSTRF